MSDQMNHSAHPREFRIEAKPEHVELSWNFDAADVSTITGIEVWRTGSRVDSVYALVATLDAQARQWKDSVVTVGWPYYYYLRTVGSNGLKSNRYATQTYTAVRPLQPSSTEKSGEVPGATRLHDAYPNLFNPQTIVGFDLVSSSDIRLSVYDILGRKIAVLTDGSYSAGTYRVAFDGHSLASGVYLIRLSTPSSTHISRMTLLK